jgi:hypothetical protein
MTAFLRNHALLVTKERIASSLDFNPELLKSSGQPIQERDFGSRADAFKARRSPHSSLDFLSATRGMTISTTSGWHCGYLHQNRKIPSTAFTGLHKITKNIKFDNINQTQPSHVPQGFGTYPITKTPYKHPLHKLGNANVIANHHEYYHDYNDLPDYQTLIRNGTANKSR